MSKTHMLKDVHKAKMDMQIAAPREENWNERSFYKEASVFSNVYKK